LLTSSILSKNDRMKDSYMIDLYTSGVEVMQEILMLLADVPHTQQ
jgi:hypothetical protein